MQTETEDRRPLPPEMKPMSSLLSGLSRGRYADLASSQCQTCLVRTLDERGAIAFGRIGGMPCPECVERWGLCAICGSTLTVTNSEPGEPTSAYQLDPCIYPHEANVIRESNREYATVARIPQHYARCRTDNWEPPKGSSVLRHVADYCSQWPPVEPVMLMTGLPGTGKTHLAIGALFLMRDIHGDKARGRFWPVIDLLERFRRIFDADRATETIEQAEEALQKVPVLVLDDFGAHKSSEWAEERLFHLIDQRYSARKTLIVTTNMTLQELPARVKSRLASGSVVNFANIPDRRLAS